MEEVSHPHYITTAVTVLQANRAYRNGLRSHIEQMKEELAGLEEMIELAERDEDEFQADVSGSIMIPGQRKVVGIGLIPPSEIAKAGSPFHSDVNRVQRYKLSAEVHAMRSSELELLVKGVRNENMRLQTLSGSAVTVSPDDIGLEQNSEGLDWDRIRSLVVSDLGSFALRTPEELRVRWVATEHPKVNHETWSADETKRAKELVEQTPKGQTVNWVDVAQKLGTNRLPLDIMRHTVKRKTHRNDKESDERLAKAVELYGGDNWQLVARQVSEDATAENVEKRWINTVNPARPTGPWTPEEDENLQRAVAVFDQQWAQIAPFMGGRTAGQCRDHFEDGLKPIKKDSWTSEELDQLRTLVGELGKKWTEISKRMEGRSDAQCRRAWNRLEQGEIPGQRREKAQQPTPEGDLAVEDDVVPQPAKSRTKAKGKKKAAASPPPAAEDNATGMREEEAGPSHTSSRLKPKPKPKAIKKTKAFAATTPPDASDTAGSTDPTPAPTERSVEERTDADAEDTPAAPPKKRKASTTTAASRGTKRKNPEAPQAKPKPATTPSRRQPARSTRSSRATDDA